MTTEVRFTVLGSLGVSVDGTRLVVRAPRQRVLLARLLLDANRPLRPDLLIDGIWGDAIPQHPDAALQIVVSRLRTALGPAADRVTFGPDGYSVEVADEELDLLHVRMLLGRSQELAAQDDFAAVAAHCDLALSYWTVDALADLTEPQFEIASSELRELRFTVYELRTRAYLRMGRHVEILNDIQTWTRVEPWRERLRAYHVLALYRAGRRVEALAVCDDLRRCLREELGVEPSTFVVDLETRIREQDPELLARRSGIAVPLPAWTPSGLPFVGRGEEEIRIFDALRDVAGGGTTRMILVEGDPGIGKSRLVLESARRAQDSAIILALDGADALRPGLQTIASALARTTARLTDRELRLCLGRWPGDLAEIVPALRRRLPDLPDALVADDEARGERLRAAVVSAISALSQRAPVLILLDDLHRAGPALLVLLGTLLVEDEPKRVLVLATARSDPADHGSRLEQLAERLQRRGVMERLRLEGLPVDSVRYLLERVGHTDTSDADRLVRMTNGHPYLLGEFLRASESDPSRGADDAASRVGEFVLRSVAALGDPIARLLSVATAIDGEFDVALLTELSHGTPETTIDMVDRAIRAGLLHNTGLGAFDFVHELARRAVAGAVDPDVRSELHRDVATALERRGAPAARIAWQWSRVTGGDADRATAQWAERAGAEALESLDPHGAIEWFRLAGARVGRDDERHRARLLVRLAGAEFQAGDSHGPETLREALAIARRLDDHDLLVEVSTLWSPIWTSMPTLSAPERIELLRESAAHARDLGIRAKLLARLATELAVTEEWRSARDLAEEALTAARRSANPEVFPEVCMRHFQATGSPHNLATRTEAVREALALSGDGRHPVQRFSVLSTAASAAIEAADLERADAFLDAAFTLARAADVPVLAYNMQCIRVWRTGLAGNLREAERLAFDAMRLGIKAGIEYAVIGPGLQVGTIKWQLGRFIELLPLVRINANDDDIAASILLARALTCADETKAEAAEVFARAAAHGFDDLPLGLHWAGSLIAAAEVAYKLGDVRTGRVVRELLEPFADRVAFNGTFAVGTIAFGAGLGAAVAGEASADDFFDEAISIARRLRAPILQARAQMAWSRVLESRGTAPVKARALARDAVAAVAEAEASVGGTEPSGGVLADH